MADLTEKQATQSVKLVGADSVGSETNFTAVDTNGSVHTTLKDSSGAEVGIDANQLFSTVKFNNDITTATGVLPVATSTTVFEHFYKSGLGPRVWSSALTGGGTETFNEDKRVAELTVNTVSGSSVYRQTRKRFRYYPGRSMFASMTFNANGNQTNIRKRFGYFDVNDGMYLEFTGTDIQFVIRSSSSGTPAPFITIPRSQWIDKLDGTGPSGLTIDFTKTVFMMIEFLWQGAGYVKLSFLCGREPITVVDRSFFGTTDGVTATFMANPTLPFRAEVENTGTSTGVTVSHICTSLRVHIDDELEGIPIAINSGTAGKSVNNTPVLSLRVRASTPTRLIELTSGDIFIGGNNTAFVNVYLNATLTGASWVTTGSCSEYDLSATAFTGGTLISSKIIRGNVPMSAADVIPSINKILGESIDGTKDVFTITVQSFSGTLTAHTTIEWKEI